MLRRFFLLPFLLLPVACGDEGTVESETVGTGEVYARMYAVSGGTGDVTVVAQLRDSALESANYLRLSGDDRLTASTVSLEQTPSGGNLFEDGLEDSERIALMKRRDVVTWSAGFVEVKENRPEYYAHLPTPEAGEGVYVTFEREVDTSLRNAVVYLPPAFDILSPNSEASVAKTEAVTLQWSVSDTTDYSMRADMGAECEDGGQFTATVDIKPYGDTDSGSAEITPSSAFEDLGSGACVMTIVPKRIGLGVVANDFGGLGGIFQGVEQRAVSIIITD